VSLEDVQPTQDRALVIRRSSSVELAGTFRVLGQGERVVKPSIALLGGLDVKVSVDEDGFLFDVPDFNLSASPAFSG
jgi:hypothetical protein